MGMPESFLEKNKTLMGGNGRSNRGARIEEKITQKLPHLGILQKDFSFLWSVLSGPHSIPTLDFSEHVAG